LIYLTTPWFPVWPGFCRFTVLPAFVAAIFSLPFPSHRSSSHYSARILCRYLFIAYSLISNSGNAEFRKAEFHGPNGVGPGMD